MSPSGTVKRNKIYLVMAIGIITLAGLYLRVVCCNWGNPLQLHPDEPTIVAKTIDMLKRHSWEADVYNRPDHFEIKCNALLFSVFSRLKYHMPAYEAFADHKMAFYKLARIYTAVFGTVMILLAAIFVGELLTRVSNKYKRIAQIAVAMFTSFSCIFVQNSAYATPDIVLTFFVLLFAHTLLKFINGNKRCMLVLPIIIGISVTIKYPAAILCIPLAVTIIYKDIEEKKARLIVPHGLQCIAIIIFTAFVIAPNLFTNYQKTYQTLVFESRSTHLGADGLGFWGNLLYYLKQSIQDLGGVSLLFVVISVTYMIVTRYRQWLAMSVGLCFWVCMSILSLHWQRWGIPMYVFYAILSAIGIAAALAFLDTLRAREMKHKWIPVCIKYLLLCELMVWTVSLSLSGICYTISRTLPDVRNIALSFVNENHIVSSEAISEGYTPFRPASAGSSFSSFIFSDNTVKPPIKFATKKYLITNSSFKDRYLNERDRYPKQCAFYEIIEQQYDVIYRINGGQGNYENDPSLSLVLNIRNAISYLSEEKAYSGGEITIYDLSPHVVQIKNCSTGEYLCPDNNEPDSVITTSNTPYKWVLYENSNGTLSLIANDTGMAISANPNSDVKTEISMQESTGDEQQQWSLNQIDNAYSITHQNLILSCAGDSVVLDGNNKESNQLWVVEEQTDDT